MPMERNMYLGETETSWRMREISETIRRSTTGLTVTTPWKSRRSLIRLLSSAHTLLSYSSSRRKKIIYVAIRHDSRLTFRLWVRTVLMSSMYGRKIPSWGSSSSTEFVNSSGAGIHYIRRYQCVTNFERVTAKLCTILYVPMEASQQASIGTQQACQEDSIGTHKISGTAHSKLRYLLTRLDLSVGRTMNGDRKGGIEVYCSAKKHRSPIKNFLPMVTQKMKIGQVWQTSTTDLPQTWNLSIQMQNMLFNTTA